MDSPVSTVFEVAPNQYGHYVRLTLRRDQWWDGIHWVLEQVIGNVHTGKERSLGSLSLTDAERVLLAARLTQPEGDAWYNNPDPDDS